ncbi:MAG: DNA alkylation repair protein [Acholeplasmatales bacterium]|nr:DNA alkylation repair protein [Acholeplasmatales bacterium]
MNISKEIKEFLFQNQDKEFQVFQQPLIPNIDPNSIIGVRLPLLRDYAKTLIKNPDIDSFLNVLPHEYNEENLLHAIILSNLKDFDKLVSELDKFLPYINNWTISDTLIPNVFNKHLDKLATKCDEWMSSSDIYAIRFGIKMLMKFYLKDDTFNVEYLEKVSKIKSDEYYINMMIAWYFAEALAKQYDHAIKYIENKKLSKWVHNKAISKACDSYRITPDKKEYLKSLRLR